MSKECSCERCQDERDEGRVEIGGMVLHQRGMITCETCGNKRCPKATDHRNECTGSNEPGQKGSSWENYPRP
jgi:hypothetical protein